MKYSIHTIVCGAYQENAYLLCPEGREDAVLIDPGDGEAALLRGIEDSGRKLGAILLTHGHFDHMLAAQPLSQETGAPVYVHAQDIELLCDPDINGFDPGCTVLPNPTNLDVEALGDELEVCGIRFKVLHTPGHTKGSVCYYDEENGLLFSGDTLFRAGFGRMDLYGGSPKAMRDSLRMLFALPGDVRAFPGHGSDTTIAEERGRYRL